MIFILWCACLFIHSWITVSGSISISKYKDGSNSNRPRLSVIVAARNEKDNLKTLYPLLENQIYQAYEIIIVLDRCTDGSKKVLSEFTSDKLHIVEVDTVPSDWNPKKYALNQGVKRSSGEWLVFTDADCQPSSSSWLKSMMNQMDDQTDIVLGISPYRSHKTILSQYISYEAFLTAFKYTSRALAGSPYMAVGRNMAIRKTFFNQSGGYESIKGITGGDDDLFIQQYATGSNTKVALGNEGIVITEPEKTWKNYLFQKLRHLSVGSKYKSYDKFSLTVDALSHMGCWILLPFVATQVFFLPLLLFYLFIKLVSYRFAASKMEVKINYMLLPLVDMLYALLTPVVAIWSKLVKDIEWKN